MTGRARGDEVADVNAPVVDVDLGSPRDLRPREAAFAEVVAQQRFAVFVRGFREWIANLQGQSCAQTITIVADIPVDGERGNSKRPVLVDVHDRHEPRAVGR